MIIKTRKLPERTVAKARSLRRQETDAEGLMWWELKNRQLNGYKFSREVPVGRYVADFVCRECNLVVEIDGSQHAGSAIDRARTAWLIDHGYSVLRFWNHEVLNERRAVLETVVAALEGQMETSADGWRFSRSLQLTSGREDRPRELARDRK